MTLLPTVRDFVSLGSRGIEFFDTLLMVGCTRTELAFADRS